MYSFLHTSPYKVKHLGLHGHVGKCLMQALCIYKNKNLISPYMGKIINWIPLYLGIASRFLGLYIYGTNNLVPPHLRIIGVQL